jgi:hypothetical protein
LKHVSSTGSGIGFIVDLIKEKPRGFVYISKQKQYHGAAAASGS